MITLTSIPKGPILIYDCSGQGRHRDNWKIFYSYADCVFFVIDATDEARIPIAGKYLKEVACAIGNTKKKEINITRIYKKICSYCCSI